MYRRTDKRYALTLIELLISILLFSAITAATVLMLSTGLKILSSNKDRADIRQNGSLVMERMVRYLELANNITSADTNSITFASDVDNDGTDEAVAIVFDIVNKKLNGTIDGVITTLTPYAQSFSLSYCAAGTEIPFVPPLPNTQAERDTIRVVSLSLTMNKGSDTVTLGSSVFCRNQGVV